MALPIVRQVLLHAKTRRGRRLRNHPASSRREGTLRSRLAFLQLWEMHKSTGGGFDEPSRASMRHRRGPAVGRDAPRGMTEIGDHLDNLTRRISDHLA